MKNVFRNVGHYFAVAGRALLKTMQFMGHAAPALEAAAPIVTAASAAAGADPDIVALEKAAFGAYGHVAEVINAGAPVNPDGTLNVTIGPKVVEAVKATKSLVDLFGQQHSGTSAETIAQGATQAESAAPMTPAPAAPTEVAPSPVAPPVPMATPAAPAVAKPGTTFEHPQ